jgi:hypothetical protein
VSDLRRSEIQAGMVRRFALKVFPFRTLFVHALPLRPSVMLLRAAITALFFLGAFDHYIGDDRGALFIAAGIDSLFH